MLIVSKYTRILLMTTVKTKIYNKLLMGGGEGVGERKLSSCFFLLRHRADISHACVRTTHLHTPLEYVIYVNIYFYLKIIQNSDTKVTNSAILRDAGIVTPGLRGSLLRNGFLSYFPRTPLLFRHFLTQSATTKKMREKGFPSSFCRDSGCHNHQHYLQISFQFSPFFFFFSFTLFLH